MSWLDPLEAEDNHSQVESLLRSLQLSSGFSLYCVECDYFSLLRLTGVIRSTFPERTICDLEVEDEDSNLLHLLRQHLNDQPTVFLVHGIESWLSPDQGQVPFFASLNALRNQFPLQIPHPVVLGGPAFVMASLARECPDFFSIRSGYYQLQAHEGAPFPLYWPVLARESSHFYRDRPFLLEKSLQECSHLPDRPEWIHQSLMGLAHQLILLGHTSAAISVLRLHDNRLNPFSDFLIASKAAQRYCLLMEAELDPNRESVSMGQVFDLTEDSTFPTEGWQGKLDDLSSALVFNLKSLATIASLPTVIERLLGLTEAIKNLPGIANASLSGLVNYLQAYLLLMRNDPRAIEHIWSCQEAYRGSLAAEHPHLHLATFLGGQILKSQGRLVEAEKVLAQAREGLRHYFGPLHHSQLMTREDSQDEKELREKLRHLNRSEPESVTRFLQQQESSW